MNVRRSWLIVPAHLPEATQKAGGFLADVIVLDLEYSVPPKYKEKARLSLADNIRAFSKGLSPVFVRVDKETRWADVRASVYPGLKGIIFPGAEEVSGIAELDELISRLESERGVAPGSIELVLMLESAKGFWNIYGLTKASPRITTLGVGRIDLTMGLGAVPQNEFRLYRFLMTRALVAGKALDKAVLGAHFRPGSRGGVASSEATLKAAREGYLMGFEGCLCAAPEQIAAVNAGFTPCKDEIQRAKEVTLSGKPYDDFKLRRLKEIVSLAGAHARYDGEKSARQEIKG